MTNACRSSTANSPNSVSDMPTGRVALVTGGNRGIGREVARQLAQRGMTVLAGTRTPPTTAPLMKRQAPHAGTVIPIQLDVTDMSTIDAAIDFAMHEFGT